MTGIWTKNGDKWEWGRPHAFEDEANLHELIKENPQFLPLSGSPRLVVLGSEIQLGAGYADILAIESSGRPTIVEVKLERNPAARRSIVSQIIGYAAFLQGSDSEGLEHGPLRKSLADAGHGSILEAVQADDQEGALDRDLFLASLEDHLQQGTFRLVLVLDDVPAELERIVAYLDAITIRGLTIDLITLKVYEVNGAYVALPQRISPDLGAKTSQAPQVTKRIASSAGRLTDGADVFRASIADTKGETRKVFEELIAWAEELALLPHVRLFTYSGMERTTLLPRIMPDNAGLVTIWNDKQLPYISMWRTVFERRAPKAIASVEGAIGTQIGQGNVVRDVSPNTLHVLAQAYREANGN